MFNPERILGNLIQTGLGGSRGLGSTKMAIGLGLLGVAMEAFDHFTAEKQTQQPPSTGPSGMSAPPPPPGAPAAAPPPPPMPGPGPVPAGAPQTAPPAGPSAAEATLLIHAMIAAAYADGQLDEREKGHIMEKLGGAQITEEDRRFLDQALNSPMPLDAILNRVNTPVLARQVYTVSIMAIDVDTEAERDYLRNLARRLYLSDAVVAGIHNELGCPQI